ncbi:MAG TPA: EAL domain-containing protein, partial [Thermoanaerobaculia bacterium]
GPSDADSGDLGHLMSAADAACYMAKDGGRNRVHSYEQDDTTLAERYGQMQWIQRIESALAERRFRLFYQMIQPVEGEASGRELLCEILLRMLDRKGQLIESSAFLSAAERYHLITRLDRWVITTAFAALVEARRHTDRPNVLFALNVSAQSIADETFLPFLVEALASSSVEPRRVAFEITESAAIGKLDLVQHLMATLGELGCRFILDGFGSGLSSLAYLRNLSFDFLKIDGELVQHLGDDPVQRAMVESIHQVGHAMGMRTIAQWVETRHHFDTLRAMGIDYAQGHWLGRPQAFVHDV